MLKKAETKKAAMLSTLNRKVKHALEDLGVNIVINDKHGWEQQPPRPSCEFCRQMCAASRYCKVALQAMSQRVLADEIEHVTVTDQGCCVMGIPVRHRRRVLGVAVACFPSTEILHMERLVRICSQIGLDFEAMNNLATQECTRKAADSGDMLDVVSKLVESEYEKQISQEEVNNLSVNLATTYEELSLVYRASGSMKVGKDPRALIKSICDELCEVSDVHAVGAIIYPSQNNNNGFIVRSGQSLLSDDQLKTLCDKYLVSKFDSDNRGIVMNEFSCDEAWCAIAPTSLVAVPIVTDGPPLGVLVAMNKSTGEFDSVDLKLLNSIGNQSAVFITNNRLYGDLQDLLMGVLHALTTTIDAKDPYTCGHSRRVAIISEALARECGFEEEHIKRIYLAGLLHDIGKIGVPEATLCKKGKLTDEEFMQIKKHPSAGGKILEGIRQLEDVLPGIMYHHERLDGKGYPAGLTAEQIPIDGRIVGLADSFDAMTSDRTYRNALPLDVVCKEIRDCSGKQFDPMLVEKFLAWDLETFLEELNETTAGSSFHELHARKEK